MPFAAPRTDACYLLPYNMPWLITYSTHTDPYTCWPARSNWSDVLLIRSPSYAFHLRDNSGSWSDKHTYPSYKVLYFHPVPDILTTPRYAPYFRHIRLLGILMHPDLTLTHPVRLFGCVPGFFWCTALPSWSVRWQEVSETATPSPQTGTVHPARTLTTELFRWLKLMHQNICCSGNSIPLRQLHRHLFRCCHIMSARIS